MPKITILPHHQICPTGAQIEVAQGTNLCRGLLEQGIKIEHACDMSKACTTCHVYIREGFDSLEPATDLEEDYLDKAWGVDPDSRLSCQAKIADEDLVIEIPKYTINMVSEHH